MSVEKMVITESKALKHAFALPHDSGHVVSGNFRLEVLLKLEA